MTTSGWWDSIEVYSDDYTPETYSVSTSVETNHALLEGLRENDFDTSDTRYTYGLLTLALVFLVAGLLACVCLPCCYQCAGKSRRERLRERLITRQHRHGDTANGLLMLICSIMAVASAVGAIVSLEKTDSGLTNIEGHTQEVADDLRTTLDLVNRTSAVLDDVVVSYDTLLTELELCDSPEALSGLLSAVDVDALVADLQGDLDDLSGDEAVQQFASDVEGVAESVRTTEGVRKGVVWPTMALSMLAVITFIVIGLSAYGLIACGAKPCGPLTCIILPGTVFVSVIVWLSAASAVTLSALSGDFCIDPDTHAQDLILESTSSSTVEELVEYYAGDCSSDNSVVDAIAVAQETAVVVIQGLLPILYDIVETCSDLQGSVESVDSNFLTAWNILDDAAEITSCRNINGLYQAAVYEDLCDELPKGLLGFWVSCVFLTVLLLILAVLWGYMLRRRRTDKDFEQVEANARLTNARSIRHPFASMRGQNTNGVGQQRALSDRSSSASSRHVATTGVAPAPFASSAGHAASSGRGSVDRAGSNGYAAPAQRPVALDKPQRPSQRR